MKLLCIKTLKVDGCKEPDFIKGRIYEATLINDLNYNNEMLLINEHKQEHYFSTDSEDEAHYHQWFTEDLSKQEENKKSQNLVINFNVNINGVEEVKEILTELEERLKNLKVNISL